MKRNTTLRRHSELRRASHLGTGATRRNKFNAKPVHNTVTGETFDSKGEAARYGTLTILQRAGEISDLVLHPKIVLVPADRKAPEIAWIVDYSYTEDGRTVYEDYKPRPFTSREHLLIRLWKHFGPGLLLITAEGGTIKRRVTAQGDAA
jgi:hypothetical protein